MAKHSVIDVHMNGSTTLEECLKNSAALGFQATNLDNAAQLLRRMSEENCTTFLTFTGNLMATGLRGTFIDLVKSGFVDVVVTTGGAIDHDIIRCFEEYPLGDFNLDDVELHKKNINRIGNILVPNKCYERLEKALQPWLLKAYKKNKITNPRDFIQLVGEELKRKGKKDSFIVSCLDAGVPIFSPGLIDSAIGLQMFMFKQNHRDFSLDVTGDMQAIFDLVFESERTGALIVGGGISKHYTLGVNLLRGGLDYSVYVTTAAEYDGSLSGAAPKEAKSWGKLKERGQSAVVYGDATILLPILSSAVLKKQ
ncbi:putative deoxyhypusine synthase [uncultured archaeon]|nr:putative deoxyhypusine synthase [uncultured archaeon]